MRLQFSLVAIRGIFKALGFSGRRTQEIRAGDKGQEAVTAQDAYEPSTENKSYPQTIYLDSDTITVLG
jgi:hypothetical protein